MKVFSIIACLLVTSLAVAEEPDKDWVSTYYQNLTPGKFAEQDNE